MFQFVFAGRDVRAAVLLPGRPTVRIPLATMNRPHHQVCSKLDAGLEHDRPDRRLACDARSRPGQFALTCVGRWDTASGVVPRTAQFLRRSSGPGMPWLGRESGVPRSFGSGSLVFRCSHVRFAQRVLFVAVLARRSGVPAFLPPLVCVPFELVGRALLGWLHRGFLPMHSW